MDTEKLQSFVREKAYQYLARRDHSRAELTDKLHRVIQRHKYYAHASSEQTDEAVSLVVSEMEQVHYLDDEKFARHWVDSRLANRPRGRYMLERELAQKGVSDKIIANVLDEAFSQGASEYDIAHELAAKKLKFMREPDKNKKKVKLTRYLSSKGFAFDTIRRVVDELVG